MAELLKIIFTTVHSVSKARVFLEGFFSVVIEVERVKLGSAASISDEITAAHKVRFESRN